MILNDVFDRKRIFANRHEQENSKGGIPPGTFQEVANSPTRNAKNVSKVKIISHKDHLAGYICRNQPKKNTKGGVKHGNQEISMGYDPQSGYRGVSRIFYPTVSTNTKIFNPERSLLNIRIFIKIKKL